MPRKTPHESNWPFAYHQELELEIETLTQTGEGLARTEVQSVAGELSRWVVLVPHTIPGERVIARVFRNQKNLSHADLVRVLRPSAQRVAPRCKLFGTCGGCQLQHMSYTAQLEWKRRGIQETLQRLARVDVEVEPVVPSPRQYGYRTKITPHFTAPRAGEIGAIGFLRAGTRHTLVDVEHCPIAREEINQVLPSLRHQVRARAARIKRGATLLLRVSDAGVHSQAHEICRQRVGDLEFLYPAGSFFQNNADILPEFTEYISREAASTGARHLLDVYCGCGLLGLCAARHFESVTGVEISEESLHWARQNAAHNGITNACFIAGDAGAIFAHAPRAEETVVVLDPPRAGCTEQFLHQLVQYRPMAIVYVSCHPATQARDACVIMREAYRISRVRPFDLFPQTSHCECVITFVRGRQPGGDVAKMVAGAEQLAEAAAGS